MSVTKIFLTVLMVATAAIGTLFTVQNSSRLVQLSLDLGVTGFVLETPQPLPYLLWTAFAAGLFIGGGWGILGRLSVSRKLKALQIELRNQTLENKDDDWA